MYRPQPLRGSLTLSAVPVGVRRARTVVWTRLSLTGDDAEYLFLSSTMQPHEPLTVSAVLEPAVQTETLMMLLEPQCIFLRVHPLPAPYPACMAQCYRTCPSRYPTQMYPHVSYSPGLAGFQTWYK